MMLPSAKLFPWLALLISGGVLLGAWFFQYVLDYAPCRMCYWQRHAHKVVIGVAILALFSNHFRWTPAQVWPGLIALAFAVSLGLAFWHVGVEYKWWAGPKTCMTGPPDTLEFDPGSFLKSLEQPQKLPGCDEAVWHFLGLSMAGWNALISLAGLILGLSGFRKTDHV
ncbi:MAG: disulfide bond formation protein B [Hyphomonadaceae bacterium]|nr:disulfide bond formation protein B [Hyphomonadaceae bacterium]